MGALPLKTLRLVVATHLSRALVVVEMFDAVVAVFSDCYQDSHSDS